MEISLFWLSLIIWLLELGIIFAGHVKSSTVNDSCKQSVGDQKIDD